MIAQRPSNMDVTQDWFWEGNVVVRVAQHLEKNGWTLESIANTRTKQQGTDIEAILGGKRLYVEAKGYPSSFYRDASRASETKRTSPTSQAQHWYSHAILKVMRLRQAHPGAEIAMAFPEFPRFRTLHEQTNLCLSRIAVGCFWVNEKGSVQGP